ncbi:PorT family protein [Flavobacteriales bacterium]|nr:PorT family protein [Flavobacteriales bacterium]
MKSPKHKIITLLLIVTCLFSFVSKAQQFKPNTEIGVLLGASYYLGDLNTTHFNQPLPTAGIIIRKNIDKRFAYKAEAMFINLQSDERKSEDTIAANRGLHFRSPIYEISGQLEFNFLPYQPGNPLYTWTPFIYTGVSIFNYNPQAEDANGKWVELKELGTEGQGTTAYSDRKKYSLIQFSIPMGGGVKIAVNESFNIILEYGARKTFSDYLDDVSTTFVGGNGTTYPSDMSQNSIDMSDPNGTHKNGEQRGNPDKNDWYSFAGITLSFKLNNNTQGCDY